LIKEIRRPTRGRRNEAVFFFDSGKEIVGAGDVDDERAAKALRPTS